MEDRGIFKGCGFWVLALLWLPAGVVAQALVRFMPETGTQADAGLSAAMLPMLAGSLVLVVPCGLPLALGCRCVWRLGYRRNPADAARWRRLGSVVSINGFMFYDHLRVQVRAIMLELTPLVEPLSIDEAFMDLSGTETLHRASPAKTLAGLARRVEEEISITVSIGLSYNKFLAKIASDLDKPRGFAAIGRAEARTFLAGKPVGLLWGVGEAMGKRLARDGIITVIGELARLDEAELVGRYGKIGRRLHLCARGEDDRPVDPEREARSMSSEVIRTATPCTDASVSLRRRPTAVRRSAPPHQAPPGDPHRQAEHRRIDGDGDRPQQPRHQGRRHRHRAEPDARRPGAAAIAQAPDPAARQRQRQAAGRDRDQRSCRHQQHRRPHAGSVRQPVLRQEANRRRRHDPGRQPQQRQRPEPPSSPEPAVFHAVPIQPPRRGSTPRPSARDTRGATASRTAA